MTPTDKVLVHSTQRFQGRPKTNDAFMIENLTTNCFKYRIISFALFSTIHFLTIWWMKRFVNVRNSVTSKPTLPGIAETGIAKLIADSRTIAMHGM